MVPYSLYMNLSCEWYSNNDKSSLNVPFQFCQDPSLHPQISDTMCSPGKKIWVFSGWFRGSHKWSKVLFWRTCNHNIMYWIWSTIDAAGATKSIHSLTAVYWYGFHIISCVSCSYFHWFLYSLMPSTRIWKTRVKRDDKRNSVLVWEMIWLNSTVAIYKIW